LKKIKIFLICTLVCGALWVQGQTAVQETTPALEGAPPELAEPLAAPTQNTGDREAALDAAPAVFSRKPQFSMSMGSQFSRLGHAAYLQPTVALPITQRFQAFASLQFINSFGPGFYRPGAEPVMLGAGSRSRQSYVVMAGGNYMLNEKWNFTGSIWRDFSSLKGMGQQPVNLFSPAGGQGMMFRAQYKVNDRFSVSGGFRYGSGGGYNGYHGYRQPFYQDYNSPFGL
jgi:hypothetical protein